MAIGKTLTDAKGVSTSYHRIGVYAPDYTQGKLFVNMFGYVNAGYRDTEKQTGQDMHVSNTAITLDLPADDSCSRESIYQTIMALPEFEGSTVI